MPSMNAALGISQLENQYLNNINKRIKLSEIFNQNFNQNNKLIIPKKIENCDHLYQQYTIALKEPYRKYRNDLQSQHPIIKKALE